MLHGFHGARVLYRGNHPALVSDDIFRRVQALMQERREQQAAPKRRSLLSGLLICAECGGKMRSKSQWVNWPKLPKKLHHTYVCYNYLGEPAHLVRVNCKAGYRHGPELEARVIQALCAYAFQPELMEQAIAEVLASADGEVQQAELQNGQLQKGLASVKRRLERYMAAFEDGTLDAVALRERVSELQAKREDLETQVTRITEAQRHREVTTMKAGQVRRDIQALPALLPEMTRDELWTILHSLVAQIRVDAKGQIAELKFWQ
jgi:site-specific DNA recombinase